MKERVVNLAVIFKNFFGGVIFSLKYNNKIGSYMSKSQQQKEKETKGKVPNAYEVNPRLMEELSQITP